MEQNRNNNELIDLTVDQSDLSQSDKVDITLEDGRPVKEFALSGDSIIKSEVSPEDVSKAVDKTSN